MPDPSPEQLAELIHTADARAVIAVTGGGSSAIADLLQVPGASRTVIEAVVPYDLAALEEFLGGGVEQACSCKTARAMAMTAWQRARDLCDDDARVLGVGCSASLVSDRPKRGEHRVHLALQSLERTTICSVVLAKDRRTRAEEEQLTGRLLLNLLAEGSGIDDRTETGLGEEETVVTRFADAEPEWQDLMIGLLDAVCDETCDETGEEMPERASSGLIFPGAFHPRHDGHVEMARIAAEQTGRTIEWEISIANVDKPALDYLEITERLAQFADDQPVWLTRAATFDEKSRLFPGATFVVGADTIERIAASRYYGDDPVRRDVAVRAIVDRGCRLLVFGRRRSNEFVSLGELELPLALRAICDGVPEAKFRSDTSSTDVRNAGRP
jgi:hypothetical protein